MKFIFSTTLLAMAVTTMHIESRQTSDVYRAKITRPRELWHYGSRKYDNFLDQCLCRNWESRFYNRKTDFNYDNENLYVTTEPHQGGDQNIEILAQRLSETAKCGSMMRLKFL